MVLYSVLKKVLQYRFANLIPQAGIYLLKFNNENIRTMFETCSNKKPERRQWRSGVFTADFN